ncbi:MAG: hemolysin family protein [Candidatus Omnitrophota bacterium]
MGISVDILLILFLVLLAAFFAASETSIFSLSRIEQQRLSEKNPHRWVWIQMLLTQAKRTLISILIGNMMAHIFSAAIVTLLAIELADPLAASAVFFLYAVFLIVFGEILPKVLAVQLNTGLAQWTAFPLKIFSILILPLRESTRWIEERILLLLVPKARREQTEELSEKELKTIVRISEEHGILDRQERYMIQKLFELGERPVKAIMTPRVDMKALDAGDSQQEHIRIIHQRHHTHFPVYEKTVDNLLGIVLAQEYLLHPDLGLDHLMREPLFVPETKRISELLAEFKKKNESFAVCVDEYGGTAGIVTMEDILEEIFGEYYDEYAQIENPIRACGHDEYLVEAKIPLAAFNEYFSTRLNAPEVSSLAGFILEKLGRVPEKGAVIQEEECEIHILDVLRKRRIRLVSVRLRK